MLSSLIWVGEWSARFPEQRAALIQELIQQRERQLMLYRDVRELTRTHLFGIGRSLMMLGITIFSLLVTLGALAELARLFQRVEEFKITLPATVVSQSKMLFDFGSHLPSSPMIQYIAKLPLGDLKQAGLLTFGVIVLILLGRFISVYRGWRHTQTYESHIRELEAEIQELRSLERVPH